MQHLTSLVLSLSQFGLEIPLFDDLDFPALRSLNLSGDNGPPGLVHFAARHSLLHNLHLGFRLWILSDRDTFKDHSLPQLRALMLKSSMFIFDNFLGKRPVPESAEVICSRRPHFEHLRLDNIRDGPYQLKFVQPLGRQLRRLDLHFVSRTTVFEDWFRTFLESFAVLVELSITLNRRTDDQGPVLSESILVSHLFHPSSGTNFT